MKAMVVIDGKKTDSYQDFKERILDLAKSVTEATNPEKLKVVCTDHKPPTVSVVPFARQKVAIFSVYGTNNQLPGPLLNAEGFRGAFKVKEEALPVAYVKDWPDGKPTPGVNLLTLFRQKPGLPYSDFIDRWHNGHTPLSLKIHPLWNYNRNVIETKFEDTNYWYDGIVEEQVRKKSDLLNPFRFFGHPLLIIPNMLKVYVDVKGFIDYGSIETYLANEYWIKS